MAAVRGLGFSAKNANAGPSALIGFFCTTVSIVAAPS